MTLPAWKMPAYVNALLAVLGLAAVVALTVPSLDDSVRIALDWELVAIWGVYLLQLLTSALAAGSVAALRNDGAALAVDVLAVVVPLALPGDGNQRPRPEPVLRHLGLEAAQGFDLVPPGRQGAGQRGQKPHRRHVDFRHRAVRRRPCGLPDRARRPAAAIRQHSAGHVVGGGDAVDHRLWRRNPAKLCRTRACRRGHDQRHRRVRAVGRPARHRLCRRGAAPGFRAQMAIGVGRAAVPEARRARAGRHRRVR